MIGKQNLLILGAGGFAKSIGDVAQETGLFNVFGYAVNMPPFERDSFLSGKPIFWIDELEDLDKNLLLACGLGSMKRIRFIEKVSSMGFQFTNIIHPTAYVSPTVNLGEGIFINSGSQIASDASLSDHVIINRGALIGHGVRIEKYSVISPGANIASNVNVGARTTIGMGTIIIDQVKVGNYCFVGAGSLVTQDVPDNVKVVGVPARIIEKNIGIDY